MSSGRPDLTRCPEPRLCGLDNQRHVGLLAVQPSVKLPLMLTTAGLLPFGIWSRSQRLGSCAEFGLFQVPTSIPKCNTGHLRREGGARAAQMAGRRGLRLSGNGGSGPGTAAVPSGRRISGLSGQRKAAAGAGRVRPGAGRAQPDRSPDGRDGLIRSTPSRRGHPRCREAGRRCQGGRARRNTSAGVR